MKHPPRFGPQHGPDDWPSCPHCGSGLDWQDCGACEDGYSYHDCGEDCCCCLDPEPNVTCDLCEGDGGWWWCWNRECPGKQDGPPERVGAFGEPGKEVLF